MSFLFYFLWSCSHSSCCKSDTAIQSINYLIRFQMSLWYSGSDLTNVNVHRERVNLLFSAVKPHTVLNFLSQGADRLSLWHLGVDCWCASFCTSLTLPNVTVSLGTSLSIKPNHSFCTFISHCGHLTQDLLAVHGWFSWNCKHVNRTRRARRRSALFQCNKRCLGWGLKTAQWLPLGVRNESVHMTDKEGLVWNVTDGTEAF